MTAGEIRTLARHAGVGPGTRVLDLCCGIAGPGRLLARELGCELLGVDASASAVAIAREQAPGPGDAAAQVQHLRSRADAGVPREGPDLTGGHEALLPDEPAGRVRRDTRVVEGPVERGSVVLSHVDATPPGRSVAAHASALT